MESGIYNEHKTIVVMGGRVGLAVGHDEEGNYSLLIGELDKEYERGEKISDADAQDMIKNAEVCLFFPTVKDVAVLRNILYELEQELIWVEKQKQDK